MTCQSAIFYWDDSFYPMWKRFAAILPCEMEVMESNTLECLCNCLKRPIVLDRTSDGEMAKQRISFISQGFTLWEKTTVNLALQTGDDFLPCI